MSVHPFYECVSAECALRFPAYGAEDRADTCPFCSSPTQRVAELPASYLVPSALNQPAQRKTIAILDNIRSANNVGAAFRTADAAGIAHIYLCGITATPDNKKVQKTALGAEAVVPWAHERNSVRLAQRLQAEGVILVALEGGDSAESLESMLGVVSAEQTIALIVGNELSGVDPALIALCDHVVALPMRGIKQSLNVAVAFGIAAYALT